MHKRSGEYNPYQFQIEYYVQLPEDIAVEIITDTEASDITDVAIEVINDWLRQQAEIWNWTDGVTYE